MPATKAAREIRIRQHIMMSCSLFNQLIRIPFLLSFKALTKLCFLKTIRTDLHTPRLAV